MSTPSAFSAIYSLTGTANQITATVSNNPVIAFSPTPMFNSNVIIESGFNLQFHNPADNHTTNFRAGNQLVDINYTWPLTQGGASTFLQNTDGAGTLGWVAVTGSVSSISAGSANIVLTPNPITTTGTIDLGSTITLTGNILLPNTNTALTAGVIKINNNPFIHGFEFLHLGRNTFIGTNSGSNTASMNIVCINNTGVGINSLAALTSGSGNIGMGPFSLNSCTSGSSNVSVGESSLQLLTTGSNNTALGEHAGINYTGNESGNILIAHQGIVGESNIIRIGTNQTNTYLTGSTHIGNLILTANEIEGDGTSDLIIETTASNKNVVLAPNGTGVVNIANGTNAVSLNFYNSAGTQFVGFKAGTLAGNTTWILPAVDSVGVWISDGVGNLSITNNINLNTLSVAGALTVKAGIISQAGFDLNLTSSSAQAINIQPNSNIINLAGGTGAAIVRYYNAATTFYSGFKAGALTTSTTWTFPLTDSTGTQALVSNGAGILSWGSFGAGTVTSITAGTNLTGGTITGSGTIALSATPSGLTSLGVGNLTISASNISSSAAAINLSSSSNIFTLNNGANAAIVKLYNNAGNHFGAFTVGSLSVDTTWVLPTADTAGVMVSNGSANLSLTSSPQIFRPIVFNASASPTFALTDANTFQKCDNVGTQTLTVPTNASVAFPIGTEIDIYQSGLGQVVISPAGGVTIDSAFGNLKIASRYTGATLKKYATDNWCLVGNLTA